MEKYGYSGSEEFRPLSPWAYFGYSILFSIPFLGWIFLIVLTFNSSNINRRNFARSYWCFLILAVIAFAVTAAAGINLLSIIQSQIRY